MKPNGEPGYEIGTQGYSVLCTTCQIKRLSTKRIELQKLSAMSPKEIQSRFADIETKNRPDTKKMLEAFQGFVKNGATGMLTVFGTNGNGKTAVLIAAVNECLDKGIPAIYITASDLLNWIQDAFNRDNTTKDGTALDRLTRIKQIRVLAIDELQAIKMTDWRREQLENLIDHRWRFGTYDVELGTLFAMNEHPSQLQSNRILSRISHGSAVDGTVIENNDPDLRPYLQQRK